MPDGLGSGAASGRKNERNHRLKRMKARTKPAGEQADLGAAARVLDLEAKGLMALAAALDDRLVAALDILSGLTGRVVVTGMGKSGHIARKIASTMASVGTPAMYVHPGEASHGDLGMITEADAVLALSNSGETPELSDIIAYCKRANIKLLAITGDRQEHAGRAGRRRARPAAQPRGLSARPGADHLDDHGDGARRRARRGAPRAQGLLGRGFPGAASGRPARAAGCCASPTSCTDPTRCRWSIPTWSWPTRSSP